MSFKADGYLRVFMYDLEIVASNQDYKSDKHFVYEWLFGFGNWSSLSNVVDELSEKFKKI